MKTDMQPGPPTLWRDIAAKHHAAFLDEMQGFLDAALADAVATTTAAMRAEADQMLAAVRAEAEAARLASENALIEQQETQERQRKEQEMQRKDEVDRLRAEAQASLAEVRTAFDRSRESEIEKTRKATGQSLAEQWNQTLRLLRQSQSSEAAVQILADAAGRHADRIAVLVFEGTEARTAASRNVEQPAAFPVAEAPAVQSVIETRDPVVTLASETELSAPLHKMLQPVIGERAYLFPVRGQQAVVAVLAAQGKVAAAPLEFLCEAAGFQFDVLSGGGVVPEPAPEPEEPPVSTANLIQISGVKPAPPAPAPSRQWNELDPAERQLHLQAQRFSRVQAAQLRLYKGSAVQAGILNRRLYLELKSEIDEARKQFLQRFLSASPNMVDYLHLEILRSLANDDDSLLGDDYPGPMV